MEFEYRLRMLVTYVQQEINSTAFAMYQPGYITIGYFNVHGQLQVIADTNMMDTDQITFDILYEQIQQRINDLEPIDISLEF